MEDIIFTHTTTIGMRKFKAERSMLERKVLDVQTQYGTAQVKCVQLGGKERYYPEYESVAALARNSHVAFYDMYNEIIKAASSCKG